MDEITAIFSQEMRERADLTPLNPIERIEQDVKNEFNPQPDEDHVERKATRDELNAKKRDLESKLKKCRNVKNARMTAVNNRMAEKRKEIRRQIATVDMDLHDLDIEEEGYCKRKGVKEEGKVTAENLLGDHTSGI